MAEDLLFMQHHTLSLTRNIMHDNRGRTLAVALLMTVGAGACTKPADRSVGSDSARATVDGAPAAGAMGDTGAMKGMRGMQGREGMQGMQGMMDTSMNGMGREMQAHMQSVMGASGESIKGMLPKHRQMVANMIAKMNGEMRDMKMAGDAEWSATVDSLRKDLVRLPELSSAEVTAMMPAHMARVTRLGAMHQQMMRSMGSK